MLSLYFCLHTLSSSGPLLNMVTSVFFHHVSAKLGLCWKSQLALVTLVRESAWVVNVFDVHPKILLQLGSVSTKCASVNARICCENFNVLVERIFVITFGLFCYCFSFRFFNNICVINNFDSCYGDIRQLPKPFLLSFLDETSMFLLHVAFKFPHGVKRKPLKKPLTKSL